MKDNLCKIISNEELSAGYYRLQIEKPFEAFVPGQFCMLRVPGLSETLLRRPFSLCQETDEHFEIVYKAVGPTTWAMSGLASGREVIVLGPLGSGLNWDSYERVIGVAGGYGIAPMLGLGHHLAAAGIAYEVYYGARSKSDLLLQEDFKAVNVPLHVSTEDGSTGFRGRITDLMAQQLASPSDLKTLWFVCGPHGLLHAASDLATQLGHDCQVSMEEYMGCGIGVCLGCVVKTREGTYQRSCVEGPVMAGEMVAW